MTARITFYGGAGTVTGANFLLDAGDPPTGGKILIDCGIHEREQLSDPRNYDPFPYDPRTIDALLVTHAHQDHIGRIPKLVREGFSGPIYSTPATRDLSAIMFEDALGIMRGFEPQNLPMLYEREDADRALSLWKTHGYHETFPVGGTTVEFLDAGHILGSAMARATRGGRNIIFTGDLGNSPEPLLNDTESPQGAKYLVMESVYGDRVHEERAKRRERLREAIEEARARSGVLLIPSFSLERTQVLLFELHSMIEDASLRPIPIYLDAPLAIRVTDVYRTNAALLNPAARQRFAGGGDPFTFSGLVQTPRASESNMIHDAPNPKVIIAGAGMSHGGRIREHEKRYLSDKHAAILFVGYQAPGSLGRRIQDGEKRVMIDGEYVSVRARVETLSGYSGHPDRDQLLEFANAAGSSLEKVFVTMGEPRSSLFLAQRLHDFLEVEAIVPEAGQSFEINW